MSNFSRFCTYCVRCNGGTSKAYARQHDGLCKSCVDPLHFSSRRVSTRCPQCNEPISKYKARYGYVCDACYRANDPIGYSTEVRFGDKY